MSQNNVDSIDNLNCVLLPEKIDCFSTLPCELFIKIFKYLSLLSLLKCGAVSRCWYIITVDRTLYNNISVQFEYKKQISFLKMLIGRCKHIKRFEYMFRQEDLAGLDCTFPSHRSRFSPNCFCCSKAKETYLLKTLAQFFQCCCQELTHLKLVSDTCCFNHIVNLDCCIEFYNLLNLKKLKSMELGEQFLKEESLTRLLNRNPDLECLKLDHCSSGDITLDSLLATVGRSNKKISCLEFYPARLSKPFYPDVGEELFSYGERKRRVEKIPIECLSLRKLIIKNSRCPIYENLLDTLYNLKNLTSLTLIFKPDPVIQFFSFPYLEPMASKSTDFCAKVFKNSPKLQKLKLSASLLPVSDLELKQLEERYPKLLIIMPETRISREPFVGHLPV